MSEIRKHYFLDERCIIATERSKRPTDFKREKKEVKKGVCAFCPGNEGMTPPADAVYKDAGGEIEILKDGSERVRNWKVRCFPNLYPALSPETALSSEREKISGYGHHEVIAETQNHEAHPGDLSDDEIKLLMRVYRDRFLYHNSRNKIEYVSLFRNHRPEAGASLSHPHTQVISLPFFPSKLSKERKAIGRKCHYCGIAAKESDSERKIAENEFWLAFAPFCSRTPFEVWILPKGHVPNIGSLDDEALHALGIVLRNTLRKIKEVLDDPPYNYMFFQMNDKKYHLNIRLEPKLTIAAGFEMNTDVYINSVPPEEAAKYLR